MKSADSLLPDDGLPRALRAVILALEEKERKRFGDFLAFAHFNPHRKLPELFEIVEAQLAKPAPEKELNRKLQKAGISATALPKLFTLLHQRLDLFLCLSQLENAPHFQAGLTLEAYLDRDIDPSSAAKKLRQWKKRIETDRHSLGHGQQLLHLEHLAAKLLLREGGKIESSIFADAHALLDLEYFMAKLKYCCASVNEAQLLKLPFPQAEVQQLEDLRKRNIQALPPFGLAYDAIWELLSDSHRNLMQFEATLETLLAQEPFISREDNFDLFNYLLNLCYLKIDLNVEGFGALTVKVYEHLIRLDLLSLDGNLEPRIYKNIVSLNCREKRWDWCRNFITTFKPLLPKEEQELLPLFCMGLVDFYSGDHASSAKAFRQVIEGGPEDHFWALESRNMLLKAYFHLFDRLSDEEYEALGKLLDAFRMFVRRHARLDSYHQDCYQNFIQYFQQMLRHLESEERKKPFPNALVKAVEAEEKVTNKAWLMRVLKEKK